MSFPHRKDTRPGTTPGQSDLSEVVQWLKMTTHRTYSEGVRRSEWVEYQWKVWQEGYHDHIVRNDKELEVLRRYVSENAERWDEDQFYE
ncbi:MAG: transposase [Thermomicrobiales bacterium]|nr:transposase [Thermomicrobiales bacterium]